MGNNPVVQFILQPVLIFGVVFHFIMGFILEIKNYKSRSVKYISFKGSANASWVSRNMITSGIVVISFLGLHFYDFWVPEMNYKYVEFLPQDPERYHEELVHKFHSPLLAIYALLIFYHSTFHGFSSSFQSMGLNNKYSRGIKLFTVAFSLVIPAGFIFIAIFHHLNV